MSARVPAVTEGYLWRFTEARSGRVLIASCAVNQHRDGPWASVVLAAAPGAFLRTSIVDDGVVNRRLFEVRAGEAFRYTKRRLSVGFADGSGVWADITPKSVWPRRALPAAGVFALAPGLPHHWQPHLFDAHVTGSARLGDETWDLDGCTAYGEKVWGTGFPTRWWWGQAQGFDQQDVCVTFAGSVVGLGRATVNVSVLVARVGEQIISLAPPLAVVRSRVETGRWHVRGRDLRSRVTVKADAVGSVPHALPLPVPARRQTRTSAHYLSGRLHLRVERDGRRLFDGGSRLASLEAGEFLSVTQPEHNSPHCPGEDSDGTQ